MLRRRRGITTLAAGAGGRWRGLQARARPPVLPPAAHGAWFGEGRGWGQRAPLTTTSPSSNVPPPTSSKSRPSAPMFKFQSTLPRLPVLSLEETGKRYVEYLAPLVGEEQLRQTQRLVHEFVNGEGRQLQQELLRLDQESPTSWLEGWWDTMYLNIRDPLAINVNPYFLFKDDPSRSTQVARAAGLVNAATKLQKQILDGVLEPDMERTTPLCMSQYERLFATTRIPLQGRDECRTFPSSRHIAVISNNHIFEMDVFAPDYQVVPESHIKQSLEHILAQSTGADKGNSVAVLTSENRDVWAGLRAELSAAHEDNARSLDRLDRALFVLVLEHDVPQNLDGAARLMLHGNMRNRWFDKLQLIALGNGQGGLLMEHTPIDGITALRIPNEVDALLKNKDLEATATAGIGAPTKLKWHLPNSVLRGIERAEANADQLSSTIESCVLDFKHFGKPFITANKLSPDGFVQMAFQLAYHKLTGKAASTYESANTKQFLHGRTETLRSVTKESVDFTQKFAAGGKATAKDKEDSLRRAVKAHGDRMKEAKDGRGVDRHLFGLHNLAKHKQQRLPNYSIPAIFRDPSYSALTTSVLSTSNCGSENITIFGFGPVVPNGLGLGYMVVGNNIPITVSSFQGQARTFARLLEESLLEMKAVLDQAK